MGIEIKSVEHAVAGLIEELYESESELNYDVIHACLAYLCSAKQETEFLDSFLPQDLVCIHRMAACKLVEQSSMRINSMLRQDFNKHYHQTQK
jgi:hypothetical protein